MAQEYYTLERTAEVLKLSTGEVKRMQEQGNLRAFRDGSNWKFRKEDVENALAVMIKKRTQQAEAEEEEVLTFGLADDGEELPTLMADSNLSETTDGLSPADEDSDLGLGVSDDDSDLGVSLVDEDDSDLGLSSSLGESIDLSKPRPPLEEDDDLVLGQNEGGLSLADGSDDVALELDEDSDILALVDADGNSEVPTLLVDGEEVVAGNEFDLIADADDAEDSESSSQVISLDDETPFGGDDLADFGSAGAFDSSDSDIGLAASSDAFGPAPLSSDTTAPFRPTSPKAASGRSPYEASYSGKAVTALGLLCVLPVGFAGLFIFDLVRYMWSWDQSAPLYSQIIDTIISFASKIIPGLG